MIIFKNIVIEIKYISNGKLLNTVSTSIFLLYFYEFMRISWMRKNVKFLSSTKKAYSNFTQIQ